MVGGLTARVSTSPSGEPERRSAGRAGTLRPASSVTVRLISLAVLDAHQAVRVSRDRRDPARTNPISHQCGGFLRVFTMYMAWVQSTTPCVAHRARRYRTASGRSVGAHRGPCHFLGRTVRGDRQLITTVAARPDQGASAKAVQRHLGHSSATTTLDTYAHLWPDAEAVTRRALDAWRRRRLCHPCVTTP
jgi:integrase